MGSGTRVKENTIQELQTDSTSKSTHLLILNLDPNKNIDSHYVFDREISFECACVDWCEWLDYNLQFLEEFDPLSFWYNELGSQKGEIIPPHASSVSLQQVSDKESGTRGDHLVVYLRG